MSPQRHSSTTGFTIIELLIVVVIIGLLASIILASLTTVQTRARDARRVEDISTLQKALALYATSNNGIYPVSLTSVALTDSSTPGAALIAEGAISTMPRDPISPTHEYEYSTNASGGVYTLSFCLETDTIPNYSEGCGNTVSP